MHRDVLHLNIGNFPASIEQHLHPELKGRPVIVGMPKGNTSGVVVSASREARKFGIVNDMSIRRAQRMCPDAFLMHADFAVYRQFFDDFLSLCSRYSPLLEPDALGCAWIDVTASRNLFGRPIDIANAIAHESFRRWGVCVYIGCALNKSVSKIASNLCSKFTRVAPGGEKMFLSNISVTSLNAVNAKIAKRLSELGIHRIGELENVSDEILVRQFGQIGSVIKRQSTGLDFAPVKAAYPPEIIITEHTCDLAASEPAEIEQCLRLVVSKSTAKLEKRNALAGEVTLTLYDETASTNPVPVPAYYRFKKPTRSAYVMMQALNKLAVSKMNVGMEISKVRVVLSDLSCEGGHQLCIIDNGHDKEQLEKAVEQIRDRFGGNAVIAASGLARGRRGEFISGDGK